MVALYKAAIAVLKSKGASIIEVELLKACRDAGKGEGDVLKYEFKDGVNRYLSSANGKMKTLEDVIAFNNQNEKTAMPFFKQETLITCQAKGDLNSKEYTDALAKSLTSRKIITDLVSTEKLDAFCGVTNGLACCIDLVNGDYDTGPSFSTPAAISGFPHITVPMGFIHALPLGLSFFAEAYSEPKLLSMAYAYEQASKKRMPPEFQQDLLG